MPIVRSLILLCVVFLFTVLHARAVRRADGNETVIMESETSIGTTAGDVWVSDGFAYVARFGDEGVSIIDVTDPLNHQLASYIKDPGAIPHNVLVRNRYAFISYYTEGLVVLDISDPENPVEVGHYDTYPGPGG